MNVVQQLKKDGVSKGLCEAWQGKLRSNSSIEHLVNLFIRGIDFCISEDYPTIEFIRKNFKGKCEPYGVFIDDEIKGLANIPDIVLNGTSKAQLSYDGYNVSRVYVRHNSNAELHVSENAVVTVDLFDSSFTKITSDGERAKVFVFVYGNAKVDVSGSGINVVHKHRKTY